MSTTVSKYGSLCFTIRPKRGLTTELEDKLHSWIIKQPYYAYNIEMEDEARHLHCQVFYPDKKSKGDLTKALFRIQSKYDSNWDNASKKVLTSGVKIAYNDKFLEYMEKDGPFIECRIPADRTPYYPSEDEQLAAQRKANSVNTRYDSYKEKFINSNFYDISSHDFDAGNISGKLRVADWLAHVMFVEQSMTVIQDHRIRQQIINCLTWYVYGCKGIDLLSDKDADAVHQHRKVMSMSNV